MIDFGLKTSSRPYFMGRLIFVCALLALAGATSNVSLAATPKQKTFKTADGAVMALVEAAKSGSVKEVAAILGPGSRDMIFSGDEVADNGTRDLFVKAYEEKHAFVEIASNKVILYVGTDDWPFPIPIVKESHSWRFDTKEGPEEVLNRRVGRNELGAIQTCLSYVDAQHEYVSLQRQKGGLIEYAQKFVSDPGAKNGLYWETGEGEEQSPMGPLVARATGEGYRLPARTGKLTPYHGYFYRILKAQGPNAKGGAYGYVVKGKMIGGFALIAFPAKYGSSGVMTFIVNQDGTVYEKDLGRNTSKIAKAMSQFDPDKMWKGIE